MTIQELLEKIPTTIQKTYTEKICECGKTKTETLIFQLIIKGSYSAPLQEGRPESEGNRYNAFYFNECSGKKLYYGDNSLTLQEALEQLYLQLTKNNLIK